MTTQDAYEKIRAWLTRPGATRAFDSNRGSCMFETRDGNRCAVGALLSPAALFELRDAICAAQDFGNVFDGRIRYPIAFSEVEGADLKFLTNCQTLHDRALNWNADGFRAVGMLDHLAAEYGLRVVTDKPVVVPDYPPVVEREPVSV